MNRNFFLVFSCLVIVCATCCRNTSKNEIIVGALFDLTGQTSETGTRFADGIRDYIDFINQEKKINGRKVRLIEHDTAYMVTRDLNAYDKLAGDDSIDLLIGWSSAGSLALLPRLKKDGIAFTSVSFSKKLADVKEAPTCFLMAPTYSDQIFILMKYIRDRWQDKSRNPRISLVYSDTEFGRSPIPDAKSYAVRLGLDIVSEEIIFLDAKEAVDQVKRMKEKKPDYAILNLTAWPTSIVLKEARRNGLATKFMGLVWCSDEKTVALAGRDAEGFIGTFPYQIDDSIPGIAEIRKYNASKGNRDYILSARYINGWVSIMIMLEGVRRAGDDLSRSGITRGIEGIRNFSTKGITAPINFSTRDHVAFKKLKLGIVKNGKWEIVTNFLSAESKDNP